MEISTFFFLSKLIEAESSRWPYSFVQQPQLKKTGGSHNLLADAEEGSMILQQDTCIWPPGEASFFIRKHSAEAESKVH